jgi:hypothetical protein
MACQFALILDAAPPSVSGPRRARIAHLTCGQCGAHHATALEDRSTAQYLDRAAGRPGVGQPGSGAERRPTHQCRDCGHRWAVDGDL